MKKFFAVGLAGIVTLGGTLAAVQSENSKKLWALELQLEESGGMDRQAKMQVCGLASVVLDELRAPIFERFPALKERKLRAELQLQRIGHAIADLNREAQSNPSKKMSKEDKKKLKQLESDQKKLLWRLQEVESDVEAYLNDDPELSKEFKRIHNMLNHWCD